ncbi:MAG: Cdc6/Cdc18 family protein [Candidatus Heimdallarchaeota archaeon]
MTLDLLRSVFDSNSLFKDDTIFNLHYVPKKLVDREIEFEDAVLLLKPMIFSNKPTIVPLVGKSGVGKTMLALYLLDVCLDYQQFSNEPNSHTFSAVINCRNVKKNSFVNRILRIVDPGYPSRGYGTEEMLYHLKQQLEDRRAHCLLVLDDADFLTEDCQVILEQIVRDGTPVSFILTLQSSKLDSLNESFRWFLQPKVVLLADYDGGEIRQILEQRLELGIVGGVKTVNPAVLDQIVLASQGNVRVAIEMLKRSIQNAERQKMTAVHVEHIPRGTIQNVSRQNGKTTHGPHLNFHHEYILNCLQGKRNVPTGELEKAYEREAEKNGKAPIKHTQFWKCCKTLADWGLIRAKVGRHPTVKGRTTLYSGLSESFPLLDGLI